MIETTTERQATGQRVRRRRRRGVAGVAAAVLALSSCTLDFSDGTLRVLCWPEDYDLVRTEAGDSHLISKNFGFCRDILYVDYGGPVEWPVSGITVWPQT